MIDFSMFAEASIAGIPVLTLVIGLVTMYGKLGLSGNAQMIAAWITGFIIGLAYQFFSNGIPASVPMWIAYVMYGIVLGLAAPGLYDTAKKLLAERQQI